MATREYTNENLESARRTMERVSGRRVLEEVAVQLRGNGDDTVVVTEKIYGATLPNAVSLTLAWDLTHLETPPRPGWPSWASKRVRLFVNCLGQIKVEYTNPYWTTLKSTQGKIDRRYKPLEELIHSAMRLSEPVPDYRFGIDRPESFRDRIFSGLNDLLNKVKGFCFGSSS